MAARPHRRSERFMRHAMDAFGTSVYLVALAQTRSHADAQDVAQDVFCRLLVSDVAFTSAEHLKAWLLRVTVNRCRELYRLAWSRRVDTQAELDASLPAATPDPADEALHALEEDSVWQALRQLPEKLRVVALLHYVEEYSTAEIAQVLGCPTATVRTRLYRARTQMRKMLEPEGDADGPAAQAAPTAPAETEEAHEQHDTPRPVPRTCPERPTP